MRQIKFRAWEKKSRLMRVCDNLLMKLNGTIWWSFGYEELEHVSNDYILMQFTGLKDKNGKEIYEGDIVKYCQKKAIIEWNMGAFHLETIGKGTTWGMMLSSVYQQIEVTGNIYENPELLGEK